MPGTATDHGMQRIFQCAYDHMQSKGIHSYGFVDPVANLGRAMFCSLACGAGYAMGCEFNKGKSMPKVFASRVAKLHGIDGVDVQSRISSMEFGKDAMSLTSYDMHESVNHAKFVYLFSDGVPADAINHCYCLARDDPGVLAIAGIPSHGTYHMFSAVGFKDRVLGLLGPGWEYWQDFYVTQSGSGGRSKKHVHFFTRH